VPSWIGIGILEVSNSLPHKGRFPDGIIPDRSKGGVKWIFHQVSENCETRVQDSQPSEFRFPDKEKGDRQRSILWV
jgi:hypothetical protein